MNHMYTKIEQEITRSLTREEYRIFTDYVNSNFEEMYSMKSGYSVNYNKADETYKVTLPEDDILNFNDIFPQRG